MSLKWTMIHEDNLPTVGDTLVTAKSGRSGIVAGYGQAGTPEPTTDPTDAVRTAKGWVRVAFQSTE